MIIINEMENKNKNKKKHNLCILIFGLYIYRVQYKMED